MSAVSGLKQYGFREEAIQVTGGTVVTIDPPLGTAAKAIKVLEKAYPGDAGEPAESYQSPEKTSVISAALQVPVVLVDEPAVLSNLLSLPTIMKWPFKFSSLLGLPLLAKHSFNCSSRFGMPLLLSGKSGHR